VADVLVGLPGYGDDILERLGTSLEALIGIGDLLDLPSGNPEEPGRRVFLGPPSFVPRASGACLLLGVRPDAEPLVTGELAQLVECKGYLRLVRSLPDLRDLLATNGLPERDVAQWVRNPRSRTATDLVAEFQARLQAVGPSGDIAGAQILDPETPVRYYRARWRPLRSGDDGAFVARRPQAYGADQWCFARVEAGRIIRLVDLPVAGSLARGADEAWLLQAAIDAMLGHPQLVRVTEETDGSHAILDLFSPLPAWAQRRLDLLATPLRSGRGALFSYSVPSGETAEELRFLEETLWMSADQPTHKIGP
jgi:hypothetical protein